MEKKILLSKKRTKWVEQRKDVVLKGTRLAYNAAQQARYEAALLRLVKRMTKQTTREVLKLFETRTAKEFHKAEIESAMDADIASQARILTNALANKFNQLFGREATPLAEKMISGASTVSKSALQSSLKTLSGGVTIKTSIIPPTLKTVIKAATTENVALIKSISIDYTAKVQKAVMRSITGGGGLETLITDLRKYSTGTERQTRNMALDQTRKVYNSMNASRMEKVGIEEFTWYHSGGGQRPRKSHEAMNGKIFRFDRPPIINQDEIDKGKGVAPIRGLPAQMINCGCTFGPVIRIGEQ